MNRRRFVESRRDAWQAFARRLTNLRARRAPRDVEAVRRFPSEFRALCQDLSLARHRRYGLGVAGQLNDLVQSGYQLLYGDHPSPLRRAGRFLLVEFPREVRGSAGLLWLCTLLFFGPFLLLTLAGAVAPEWVFAVVGPEHRATLERNFGGPTITRPGAGSDVQMFAFYVWNNVGIDFRTFAGGIAFGLGTLFFLLYNGVVLGASFGYALHADLPSFLAFTSGHGSLELVAIVISGMAGLKLGQGLVAPGRLTRAHALRVRAVEGVRLLVGAAVMTTLAALVEAFWSASPAPHQVKYVVGAVGWAAVLAFLALGGRRAPG